MVKTSEEAQENLFRIQKDVIRTDRSHPYYSNSNPSDSTQLGEVIQANPGLQRLCDILMTYTTTFPHREDCFVQGMADLASIILITIQDEVGAFWCFAAMMDKFVSND